MKNMRSDEEQLVFNISLPLLLKIYIGFESDDDQQDMPDAALKNNEGVRIGVEITNIDPEDLRKYMSENSRKAKAIQIEAFKNKQYDRSIRAATAKFDLKKIKQSINKKENKMHIYNPKGNQTFNQMVLVLHSEYLYLNDTGVEFFESIRYWLQKKNKFDNVIFACKYTGDTFHIAGDNAPRTPRQKSDKHILHHVPQCEFPILSVNESHNLLKIVNGRPIIPMK